MIPPGDNVHEWNSRDLAYPSSKVAIALKRPQISQLLLINTEEERGAANRSDNVALGDGDTMHEAIIGVVPLMGTGETLEARVTGDPGRVRVSAVWTSECREKEPDKTHLSAMRYFGPSFSNSAITQSVIVGMPGGRKKRVIGSAG